MTITNPRMVGRARWLGTAMLCLASLCAAANDYPCLLEPSSLVKVSTAVEGILSVVSVEKGDMVEAGEVVASLDATVEAAVLAQARARVEMSASLLAREEELKLAKVRYGRAKDLSAKKFVASDELDELRSAYAIARLRLAEEKENRRLAELEVRRVQAQHDLRVIRSPIAGVVVERFLSAGEFAQAQPIVELAQLDPVNVEVVLPSDLFGRIEEGMRARVRVRGQDDEGFDAPVTVVERVVDSASDTFSVRLEVQNPDHLIPVGLECTATFPSSVE